LSILKVSKILEEKQKDQKGVFAADNKGGFYPLQHEFSVEDDKLYLFTEGDDEHLTANQLKWYIENEAEDRCWHNGYGESLFLDCEVVICFGTSELDNSDCKCVSTNVVYTGVDNTLIIHCDEEENEEVTSDSEATRDITINLSSEEVEMICNALNFYGDKVADSEGYSSGERYWNLIELFE